MIFQFSVDFGSINVDGILDIIKYLMKKQDIKCLNLLKQASLSGHLTTLE